MEILKALIIAAIFLVILAVAVFSCCWCRSKRNRPTIQEHDEILLETIVHGNGIPNGTGNLPPE